MEYSIDREGMAETVYFGAANACGHMTNPSFIDGSDKVEAFTYDTKKATKVLEEAGYVLKDGVLKKDGTPIELEYVTTTSTEDKDIAVFVQSNLKEIGIKVNITALESQQAAERMKNGEYDLAKGAHWFAPTINALSFYGLEDKFNPMGSYGGLGFGVNSDIIAHGQSILTAKNAKQFREAVDNFWQANYDACPTIPAVTWYRTAIYNDNFTGFDFNNNYFVIDLSKVTVK
jgi:ABC-type transport system substrate-binding protein